MLARAIITRDAYGPAAAPTFDRLVSTRLCRGFWRVHLSRSTGFGGSRTVSTFPSALRRCRLGSSGASLRAYFRDRSVFGRSGDQPAHTPERRSHCGDTAIRMVSFVGVGAMIGHFAAAKIEHSWVTHSG